MFTIKTRLTFWYLVSFGSIMISVIAIVYLVLAANERAQLDDELRDYGEFLVSEVDTDSLDVSDLFDKLQEVTTQANLRFRAMRFMLATMDSVIYESSAERSMGPLVDAVQDVLPEHATKAGYHTVAVGGSEYRVFIRPVPGTQREGLGLVVVTPLDRLEGLLMRLRELLLAVVPFSLLVTGVGGWYMARRALTPVEAIRTAAAAISSSNLHERVPAPPESSRDELTELAGTFNEMIARLERTFESQRRFVANASHDLRTPLMVIQTKLDHLLRAGELDPPTRQELRHCLGEADRLTRLANDLLLLARADADQLEVAVTEERLDEMAIECIGRLRALASRRNISLLVDVDEPITIACDPPTLERVLTNIVDNAITHSPDGGTVEVRLGVERAAGGRDSAIITVTDRGPGIPAEELPKIFDRFYRGDRARATSGSGLGLAIAKTIIEAHGGTIAVASSPNGTTVTIALPI